MDQLLSEITVERLLIGLGLLWAFFKSDYWPWLKARTDRADAAEGTMFERLLKVLDRHSQGLEGNVAAMTQAIDRLAGIMSKVDITIVNLLPTTLKAIDDAKNVSHGLLREILEEQRQLAETLDGLCTSLEYKPKARKTRTRRNVQIVESPSSSPVLPEEPAQ